MADSRDGSSSKMCESINHCLYTEINNKLEKCSVRLVFAAKYPFFFE